MLGNIEIVKNHIIDDKSPHIMNDALNEAFENGWAWKYEDKGLTRNGGHVLYNQYYWNLFQSRISDIIGIKDKDIKSVAFANSNKDYSIQTIYNRMSLIKLINVSKFKFDKKNYKTSMHLYMFVNICDYWLGAAKVGNIWDPKVIYGYSGFWVLLNIIEKYNNSYNLISALGLKHKLLNAENTHD